MQVEFQSLLELVSRRTPLSLHPECVLAYSTDGFPLHPSAEEPAGKEAGGMRWCLGGRWRGFTSAVSISTFIFSLLLLRQLPEMS